MRRIHIGLNVKDLDASVRFYSELFGAPPSVLKDIKPAIDEAVESQLSKVSDLTPEFIDRRLTVY